MQRLTVLTGFEWLIHEIERYQELYLFQRITSQPQLQIFTLSSEIIQVPGKDYNTAFEI